MKLNKSQLLPHSVHRSEATAQAPTIIFLPNLHGAPQPLAAGKSCRIAAGLSLRPEPYGHDSLRPKVGTSTIQGQSP